MDRHREFKLGEWQVTPLRGVIHGPQGSRRITPKAMDVLVCLAQHRGEVVKRETFEQDVWDGRSFSDEPLNKCIAELRRKLGDSGGSRDYIETIPKRGYRLVASVTQVEDATAEEWQAETRSGARIVAIVAVLAFAALAVWVLSDRVASRKSDVLPENRSIAIAVLPFENLSDTDKTYFADGVHEELIGALSRNETFALRSRTSTLKYRGTKQLLPEIAEELDVDVIVEGSVRQDGDTVRVTAQVIEANADEHLWSGNIEESLSVASLFEIQEAIAQEIATALRATFSDETIQTSNALPTSNINAYDGFMLGKYHYRRQLPGDIRIAVSNFETAVKLDPGFADAWDWLAYAYNHAATSIGYLNPAEAYPKARSAALRALEIEPELATAISILGYIRGVYDRDWPGAESDLLRAIKLDPDDSGTVWSLAHVYSILGRHDEAVDLALGLAVRFPSAGRNHQEVANRLIDAGRYDEALEFLGAADKNNAEPAQVADKRGIALVGLKKFEDALAQFEYAVYAKQQDAGAVARLAHVYGKLGRTDEAYALMTNLELRSEREEISAIAFAAVYAGLDDTNAALRYLDQAVRRPGREALGIANDPFFADLKNNAEFRRIVAFLEIPPP